VITANGSCGHIGRRKPSHLRIPRPFSVSMFFFKLTNRPAADQTASNHLRPTSPRSSRIGRLRLVAARHQRWPCTRNGGLNTHKKGRGFVHGKLAVDLVAVLWVSCGDGVGFQRWARPDSYAVLLKEECCSKLEGYSLVGEERRACSSFASFFFPFSNMQLTSTNAGIGWHLSITSKRGSYRQEEYIWACSETTSTSSTTKTDIWRKLKRPHPGPFLTRTLSRIYPATSKALLEFLPCHFS
jgi:hypothetical protein